MSTPEGAALPVGAKVVARVPAEGAKLLNLPDDGQGLQCSIRPVGEDARDAGARELPHPRSSFTV